MKKYIRSERPNLFEPNVYISVVVKLEGNISEEDVYSAVIAAYEANEATMSKVVLEENGEAYYEKMKRTGCKIFMDYRNWKTIINESERIPFSLKEGEFIRTYIIAKGQEITLLIHAHHLVGDGKSILILTEDIVNYLAGKELTHKPLILMNKSYLITKAKLPWIVRVFIKKANHKWGKGGKVFTWKDYYNIHKNYWENHISNIELKSYPLTELKKACPKGVTLNSYLIGKLLQEYPESRMIGIPVSIREENESMSNQTSGIAIKYQYKKKKSPKENLVQIHQKIYEKLKDTNMKYFVLLFISQLTPTLIDSVLLQTHGCYRNKFSEKISRIMGYTGKEGRDLGVTNLTQINIPSEYQQFKIKDILFVPPKVSYARKVVGISTYGDNLTVSYHHMKEVLLVADSYKKPV